MNTSSSPCACPLLADKKNLHQHDKLCNVPSTRVLFLQDQPGQLCHDETKCSVCAQYPEKAAQEITIQDLSARNQLSIQERAAVGRERAAQVYAAIFGNSGNTSSASR